jgi:hypothetical protein
LQDDLCILYYIVRGRAVDAKCLYYTFCIRKNSIHFDILYNTILIILQYFKICVPLLMKTKSPEQSSSKKIHHFLGGGVYKQLATVDDPEAHFVGMGIRDTYIIYTHEKRICS